MDVIRIPKVISPRPSLYCLFAVPVSLSDSVVTSVTHMTQHDYTAKNSIVFRLNVQS